MKNIAVVGAGYWGKNLVRNFYQLDTLKTICDTSPDIRRQMSRDYPGVNITDSLELVLNDPDVEGVVIAVPAVLHFELARKVLMSGRHVFVEKPLALTYEDGQSLVNLAEEGRKVLFVGHILHYHQAIIRLKEMINGGRLGRLQYIYSHRLSLGKIRREENILWSFAPHDISIILSLVGEDPSCVDSVASNFLHARVADVTVTNLKFPSGVAAHIFVSWLNPFKEQRLVVIGDKGMLVFDDTKPVDDKLVFYPHTINWKDGLPVPDRADGAAIDISASWIEPMRAECNAFLSAMKTGLRPITSGEEGLRVLRIIETSQRSIEMKEGSSRPVFKPSAYYVHETAVIDEGVQIGAGSKIWHFSHIMKDACVGNNCNIGQNVVISAGVVVGNHVKIQNNVSVYEGVELEDEVFCGPSMVFTNVYNPRSAIPRMKEIRQTLVKKGATLGANATIVCGNTIGRYAFVGAGAVVTKDVPDYAMVVGNPAVIRSWMCQCGNRIRFRGSKGRCEDCVKAYILRDKNVIEEIDRK